MQDKQLSLKDVIRQEYVKCAADPVYFMRKYCKIQHPTNCLLYTSPSPRDRQKSRMPSSA